MCRIISKHFCCQQVLNIMFCATRTVAWVAGRKACQGLLRLKLAAVLGAKPPACDHELRFHLMQHTSWRCIDGGCRSIFWPTLWPRIYCEASFQGMSSFDSEASMYRCWRLLVDAWAGMQVCCAVQVLSCAAACLQSLRGAAGGPALACCIHC